MSKNPLRNLTIAITVVATLAGAGVVYAHWRASSSMDGHVITGDVDSYWLEWSCGGTVAGGDLTASAVGLVAPPEWVLQDSYPAFGVWKTDIDVAETIIDVAAGPGVTQVVVGIDKAYPSHYEQCEWGIRNAGSIPLAAPYVVIRTLNQATTFASGIFNEDGALWVDLGNGFPVAQIDPHQTETGILRIHVEQIATQDTSYEFELTVCLHNWNEASTVVDDVCGLYEPHELADGTVIVIPGPG